MDIGQRLKSYRKQKKMTLVQLSERSGVQVATISRMENGKMTGTLESHMAIAGVLGFDVTDLYRGAGPDLSDKVDTVEPKSDVFTQDEKTSFEILTKNVMSKKMLPTLIHLQPGGATNIEQGPTDAERFLFVMTGTLTVVINDREYPLKKNMSLYLDASLPHQLCNKGAKEVHALSVTTPVML